MPALTRRFSSCKSIVKAAPSAPSEAAISKSEARSTLTPKTRRPQGARSRRSSILKRTASFPATAAGLINRTVAKGGDRNCAGTSQEQNILPSILDLSEPFGSNSPPEMTSPSSAAGTRLTTFFTAVSACPSTKAVLSYRDGDFCMGRSKNLLTALTPCASVMAMYSGMIGGFGSSTESDYLHNLDVEQDQISRFSGLDVPISQSGPRWFWFLSRWKSCIDWLGTTQNQAARNRNGQPSQGQVSPWLTIFQILAIMVLSVSLYRNMEILLGW